LAGLAPMDRLAPQSGPPMLEPRPLRRPPITEAVLDFRFKHRIDLTERDIEGIRNQIAADYPNSEPKQQFEATFKISDGKLSTSDPRPVGTKGLFAKSPDALTVAQFRGDGFTLNRLRPYTSWELLFPEALRLWLVYSSVVGTAEISRLALRYINHAELPLQEGEDFASYLLVPPTLPEPLPQTVMGFSMRFNSRDEQREIGVNITQELQPMGPSTSPRLLLDVDVFKEATLAPGDQVEIRQIFTTLHDVKNQVFFNLVTERCLQLFQ
jgi:uncharacterized protein (TIGR04255 family)